MTSSPAGGLCLRNNSRARRLARFLTTAEPSFRVAATPNRHRLLLFDVTNRVMKRPDNRRPCSYARSNSGRFRTRSSRERRSVTGRWLVLSLVRDGQTLPALRATSLQHDAAILCRHPHTEAVSLAAATRVGLKRALPLCHCDCVLHELERPSLRPVKLPILAVGCRHCQKRNRSIMVCYSSRAFPSGVPCSPASAVHSVSPPRFPHLWKTLWKNV